MSLRPINLLYIAIFQVSVHSACFLRLHAPRHCQSILPYRAGPNSSFFLAYFYVCMYIFMDEIGFF